MIDRQGQGDHTVAAVDRLSVVDISAGLSERLPEEVVAFAFADRVVNLSAVHRVDVQREGDHAVAAVDTLQGVGVFTGIFERLPEEVVACALTDGGLNRGVVGRIDIERHVHHRVAAVHRLQGNVLGFCLIERNTIPDIRKLVLADRLGVGDSVGRVDSQHQSDHTVATMLRLQGVTTCASRVNVNTSPHVWEIARADGVVGSGAVCLPFRNRNGVGNPFTGAGGGRHGVVSCNADRDLLSGFAGTPDVCHLLVCISLQDDAVAMAEDSYTRDVQTGGHDVHNVGSEGQRLAPLAPLVPVCTATSTHLDDVIRRSRQPH